MEQLLQTLLRIPEAGALAAAVEGGGCPAAVTGLAPVHRAQIAAALAAESGRPLVMVCSDEGEAGRLAGDLEILLGRKPLKLFARELFVRAGTVISRQWEHGRIAALYELGREHPQGAAAPVVVATCEALLQRTSPPSRGLHPGGAGGGRGPVRPAGRHPGRVLPIDGGARPLRIL